MPHETKTLAVHEEMLILLKKFDKICRDNDIKYTLHGGSLLGAIRDKGFIPWDDDIDVALMRDQYDKLCQVVEKMHLTGDFTFDRYANKITEFWLRRKGHVTVWLDVYIYDFISEKKIPQKLKIGGLVAYTAFTKTKTTMEFSQQRRKDRKGWQTAMFNFFYYLGKPFPQKNKIDMMQHFEKNAFVGNKRLIQRSNDQFCALGMILPKECMNQYMYVPFEDTQLMVSTSYDQILRSSYGDDYMTPKRADDADDAVHDLVRKM
jgi:lipopolysaccharide cholinephosphotransferase